MNPSLMIFNSGNPTLNRFIVRVGIVITLLCLATLVWWFGMTLAFNYGLLASPESPHGDSSRATVSCTRAWTMGISGVLALIAAAVCIETPLGLLLKKNGENRYFKFLLFNLLIIAFTFTIGFFWVSR